MGLDMGNGLIWRIQSSALERLTRYIDGAFWRDMGGLKCDLSSDCAFRRLGVSCHSHLFEHNGKDLLPHFWVFQAGVDMF